MKLLLIISFIITLSNATVVEDYLNTLKQQAQKDDATFTNFDAKRGEVIFTSKHIGKRGKEISCTSCHGIDLTKSGKNFFTGKTIKPLSPKANPKRLTSVKEMEKWLRRNFKDVYNRVGTPKEKGDAITYILSRD